MAEKQNSSDTKIATSEARRRASLPTLSRIIKSQTSSFQRRLANTSTPGRPARGGSSFRTFLLKVLVGASAVYLTAIVGIWGEPEESAKVAHKAKEFIRKVGDEKMLSEDFRGNMISKFNETKTYLKSKVESIPEELKSYYEMTEKYMNELIKGKKA